MDKLSMTRMVDILKTVRYIAEVLSFQHFESQIAFFDGSGLPAPEGALPVSYLLWARRRTWG